MVILGNKFLVWCSLVLSGLCFAAAPTVSGLPVTVKGGESYNVTVSVPEDHLSRLPASGINWYKSSDYSFGARCVFEPAITSVGVHNVVATFLTIPNSWQAPQTNSIIFTYDGGSNYPLTGISTYYFEAGEYSPSYNVSVSVSGGGSVMVVGDVRVATPDVPRIYEGFGSGDEICFQVIPKIGSVFNAYSVDGGDWVICDGSFCLSVTKSMSVVFRFVDELSFDDDENRRASEWWGTYERSSSSTTWEDWSIVGVDWAHFDEDGDMVYMYSTLIGSWQEHLAGGKGEVYLFTPSWSERFWVYRNGKHFGYVNESNQVVIGNNEGTVMGSFVESSDWWGGEEPGYGFSGFGGLVSGPVIANNEAKTTFWFEDEWGKRVFEVEDRFWTGFWDYPGYDPASPTTYPPEPFWKADPPEPPGEEDNSWLADLLKDFFEKYFVYDPQLLKWLAEDLRYKAARKFPFCLFWIPEKLPSSSEDVSVPLLDLSMFVGKDFKVDFYNNEYMDKLAETTRNLSRYIIWLLFIFHLRDIITPVMVID